MPKFSIGDAVRIDFSTMSSVALDVAQEFLCQDGDIGAVIQTHETDDDIIKEDCIAVLFKREEIAYTVWPENCFVLQEISGVHSDYEPSIPKFRIE